MPFLWAYHLAGGQWDAGQPVPLPAGWTPLDAERRMGELVVLLWRPENDPVDPPVGGAPLVTECYPNPLTSGADAIVGGSALDTCTRVEIVPQGHPAVEILPPWQLQDPGELRFVVPAGVASGPATVAAYNSAGQTGAAPFSTSIA